ncbi:hypothetical protein PIB30_038927 [Stylosanthes scabra]|uniref:RRM domain-containing protein n=1 Tax=Stylosanthes scabra TaxID=79078 RepID=A0ABU6SE15_9FABA|nr:hypothetical protein [Stylosanthes scabra]
MYKEFGNSGFVKDIFISRKKRRNLGCTFAFVRYYESGCMWRAIERLNGALWKENRLVVNESKYAYDGGILRQTLMLNHAKEQRKSHAQKWIPMKKNKGDPMEKPDQSNSAGPNGRKEIQGISAEAQLMEEWNGQGIIENRDVDPYRCLVTFLSIEARDEAMKDDLLLSVFDEVMLLWDFTSTLSRHVWIEIIGMPINMWCEQNFRRIGELWGKVVMMDDRTEELKTFTTAKVLIDSFQWELVSEWISAKIDDRIFEVYAKEVGLEVYSVESHPDRGDVVSETDMDDESVTVSDEPRTVAETAPAMVDSRNLNFVAMNDPLIDAIINEKSSNVHHLITEREICIVEIMNGTTTLKESEITMPHLMLGNRLNYLGCDPALYEAQLVFCCNNWCDKIMEHNPKWADDVGPRTGLVDDRAQSDESCPFSPGYRPCSSTTHVHREGCRAFVGAFEDVKNSEIRDCEVSSALGHNAEREGDERVNTNELLVVPDSAVSVPTSDHTESEGGVRGCDDLEGALPEDVVAALGDIDNLSSEGWDSLSENLSDDDVSAEAAVAKRVWSTGGISFGSSDEDEIAARLTNRRKGGKHRAKNQKQARKPNCLQGRTLATRSLRSGSIL